MSSGKYLKTKEQRLKIAFKQKENYLGRQLTEEEKESYVFWADRINLSKGMPRGRSKGFEMTFSHRKNISEKMRLIKKSNYPSIRQEVRGLFEYSDWRLRVYRRDNYTCQECGEHGVKLNADHIKPMALILKENNIKSVEDAKNCPELWDSKNGRTLCELCHKKTDTYGLKWFNKNRILLSLN